MPGPKNTTKEDTLRSEWCCSVFFDAPILLGFAWWGWFRSPRSQVPQLQKTFLFRACVPLRRTCYCRGRGLFGQTKEQRDLTEQFEADYDAVDRFLRGALDADDHIGFSKMVRRYADQHGGWADAELLITTAKMRNLIVHERTDLHRHVVIPTLAVAEWLQNGGNL